MLLILCHPMRLLFLLTAMCARKFRFWGRIIKYVIGTWMVIEAGWKIENFLKVYSKMQISFCITHWEAKTLCSDPSNCTFPNSNWLLARLSIALLPVFASEKAEGPEKLSVNELSVPCRWGFFLSAPTKKHNDSDWNSLHVVCANSTSLSNDDEEISSLGKTTEKIFKDFLSSLLNTNSCNSW